MVMNHFGNRNFLAANEKAGGLSFFLLGFGGKGVIFFRYLFTISSRCVPISLSKSSAVPNLFPKTTFCPHIVWLWFNFHVYNL
jgi:hypothetical protein